MTQLRSRLGASIFARVAGPDGAGRRDRIHTAAGPRLFGADRPIRRVHGDAAMFVGGLRALLLQSLHPLAMAGVAAHSGYRGDPWGRLQRTSYFLAVTAFGPAAEAQAAIDTVRSVHARVQGTSPDRQAYSAADPHLLRWVHVAEVDSFLRAHQRYGRTPLDQSGRDGYVADMAQIGTALGVVDAPLTEAALARQLAAFRPELRGTPAARAAARFVLLRPPLPLAVRAPYAALTTAAIGLLPVWSRWPLRLPYLPVAEASVIRLAGATVIGTIRWATTVSDLDGEAVGG